MIVDAWIQHPTERLASSPIFDSIKRWIGVEDLTLPSIEATVRLLAASKVDRAICSAWTGPEGDLVSNDEVASFVNASDGRLLGAASVDLRKPMAAVRELRRAVDELGFVALRILPWLWDLPPDDRRYYPLYAAAVDLGIPFLTQVGHTGPMCPSEPGRPIPYLDRVALDFPELTIVGGHVGYPWTQEMIALATKYPNVYIDTSAWMPSRLPLELVAYMKRHGRKKVLFGSNFPMILPGAALEQVDQLGLDDEARALFLGGNAQRVFSISG